MRTMQKKKKRSRSEQEAYDIQYMRVRNELFHKFELELKKLSDAADEIGKRLREYRAQLIKKEATRIVDAEE